jgi:hypothetical protein
MNAITPLTPFQRGQAALEDALSHVGYAADSDERLQFLCGLCADIFNPGGGPPGAANVPGPLHALVEDAVRTACADTVAQLVLARREARALQGELHEMTADLAPVLSAHLRGEAKALYQALTAFVARRCKVVHAGAGGTGVH